jgi:hypothetical protein
MTHVHDFSVYGDDAGFCECGAIQFCSLGEVIVLENDTENCND